MESGIQVSDYYKGGGGRNPNSSSEFLIHYQEDASKDVWMNPLDGRMRDSSFVRAGRMIIESHGCMLNVWMN